MLWHILYALIAGVCDFYFLSSVLAATIALITTVLQRPASLPTLIALLGSSLAITVLYHTVVVKRVLWLTPGEHLAGRIVESGSKKWRNPYRRNRWALFLVTLLTIVLAGNAWDSLSLGLLYPLGQVFVRAALLTGLYYGLVQVGRGQLKYIFYPIAVFFVLFLASLNMRPVDAEFRQFYTAISVGGATVHSLVGLAYYFLRRPEDQNGQESRDP